MTVKYTKEALEEAAKVSTSYKGVLRMLGIESYSGSMSTSLKKRMIAYGIDTSHFTGLSNARGKIATNRKSPEAILQAGYGARAKAHRLRRALLESGVPHVCVGCGLGAEWNGLPLVLPVDHKDGDWSNNRIENLRFLCPNCHSQTPTFGRRNV